MKKIINIFMIIIIAFSATGCKGTKQEIEKLAIVVAMGFDLSPEHKYMATVQILSTQEQAVANMGGKTVTGEKDLTDVLMYKALGDTADDALNEISNKIGKILYFSHDKYIVIGKELAEAGLSQFIDSALRGYDTRPDSNLLVTDGKASDIVTAVTPDEKIPAVSVEQLIKLEAIRGYFPKTSRMDFANALSSKSASPVIGVINLNKGNSMGATFNLFGTAVFKKDKLLGFLDKKATRGMQWVNGQVRNGNIVVNLSDKNKINFQILKAKSKIKTMKQDNNFIFEITIKEEGTVLELQGNFDPMKNYKEMEELSKIQNKAIEQEVKYALYIAQKELKADIFDFGGIIHRAYPKDWQKIENKWQDIFPNIKIQVKAESNVKGVGIISKPIKQE